MPDFYDTSPLTIIRHDVWCYDELVLLIKVSIVLIYDCLTSTYVSVSCFFLCTAASEHENQTQLFKFHRQPEEKTEKLSLTRVFDADHVQHHHVRLVWGRHFPLGDSRRHYIGFIAQFSAVVIRHMTVIWVIMSHHRRGRAVQRHLYFRWTSNVLRHELITCFTTANDSAAGYFIRLTSNYKHQTIYKTNIKRERLRIKITRHLFYLVTALQLREHLF